MLKRGFGAVSASRRYLTLAISRNPALRPVALGFFGLWGTSRRWAGRVRRLTGDLPLGQVVRR
jgi:hypothetical protein